MLFLVIGADGQLGQVLKDKLGNNAAYCASFECDVTDIGSINKTVAKYKPNAVINCAAYTNVEKAEEAADLCFAVNAEGVKNLAQICSGFKIPLIHISTDYVFDGIGGKVYTESDNTNPINQYGKSKLLGEKYFFEYAYSGAVIRTSYLYSKYGKNIVKTFCNLLSEKEAITVVNNQKVSLTYAPSLADAIINVSENITDKELYHYSSQGDVNFVELAELLKVKTNSCCVINQCNLSEYNSKVKRPICSVLNSDKISKLCGITSNHWKYELEIFCKEMLF